MFLLTVYKHVSMDMINLQAVFPRDLIQWLFQGRMNFCLFSRENIGTTCPLLDQCVYTDSGFSVRLII